MILIWRRCGTRYENWNPSQDCLRRTDRRRSRRARLGDRQRRAPWWMVREREEPRSSLACPRPATSPIRACPPPLACAPAVFSNRMRSALPPLSATAANAAPTARVACGCPSGQRALFVTRPATRVLRTVRFPARPSQASRSAPCRRGPPRFARPRRARLRLTPSPRSRRRPACPLHLPSLRAWRRSDSASIVRPRHHPTRATL